MIDHFRKKSLFFRDTRDHQEHDTKNRLSIPATSSEKPLAEIISVKKKLTLVRCVYAVSNIFSDVYQTTTWGTSGNVEYKLKPELTFQDAKQACADEGASLPIVSSENENESLVTLLESLSKVH